MDYRRTMQCAIDYMERNLTGNLDLESIADYSGFSMFHFLRVFSAHTGYTPKEYIRIRRLSKAGNEVLYTRESIRSIARKYCFFSQEAFTRAFKKQHGMTPGKLRRDIYPVYYIAPINLLESVIPIKGGTMKPRIAELGELKVIGLKCVTTMKENKIPQLWNEFNKRCYQVPNRTEDHRAFGICPYVDMKDFDEETPFEHIVGLSVSTLEHVPEGMITHVVPSAKYAVFTHKGALDTLGDTYNEIFRSALAENGLEMDAKAQLELYDDRFKYGQEDSEMDIYIPIK